MAGHEAEHIRVVEALVACLDWIRQSDMYDDQRDPATRRVVDGAVRAQPPLPGDSYASASGLQAAIDDLYALVERAEQAITPAELTAARARYRRRLRVDDH